jgi:hypothetical protein
MPLDFCRNDAQHKIVALNNRNLCASKIGRLVGTGISMQCSASCPKLPGAAGNENGSTEPGKPRRRRSRWRPYPRSDLHPDSRWVHQLRGTLHTKRAAQTKAAEVPAGDDRAKEDKL